MWIWAMIDELYAQHVRISEDDKIERESSSRELFDFQTYANDLSNKSDFVADNC